MQAKEVKEFTNVDHTKIYGNRVPEPILGNYYKPSLRTTQFHETKFDTSFPYVILKNCGKNIYFFFLDSCLSTFNYATFL